MSKINGERGGDGMKGDEPVLIKDCYNIVF